MRIGGVVSSLGAESGAWCHHVNVPARIGGSVPSAVLVPKKERRGSQDAMASAWRGPYGQVVRPLPSRSS